MNRSEWLKIAEKYSSRQKEASETIKAATERDVDVMLLLVAILEELWAVHHKQA